VHPEITTVLDQSSISPPAVMSSHEDIQTVSTGTLLPLSNTLTGDDLKVSYALPHNNYPRLTPKRTLRS